MGGNRTSFMIDEPLIGRVFDVHIRGPRSMPATLKTASVLLGLPGKSSCSHYDVHEQG